MAKVAIRARRSVGLGALPLPRGSDAIAGDRRRYLDRRSMPRSRREDTSPRRAACPGASNLRRTGALPIPAGSGGSGADRVPGNRRPGSGAGTGGRDRVPGNRRGRGLRRCSRTPIAFQGRSEIRLQPLRGGRRAGVSLAYPFERPDSRRTDAPFPRAPVAMTDSPDVSSRRRLQCGTSFGWTKGCRGAKQPTGNSTSKIPAFSFSAAWR